MKISFLINSLDMGGAEKVLLTYVQALSAQSTYDISVVTNKDSKSEIASQMKAHASCHAIFTENEYSKNNFLFKIYKSIKRKMMLKSLLNDCDVIIDFLDCDFHKYIKNFKQKKITYLHSGFHHLINRKKDISVRCTAYDAIITICHDMHNEIKHLNPSWFNKTHVIYNPFNFEGLRGYSQDTSSITSNEKVLLASRYILTVCRLNEETKDVDTLLKAYCLARENGLNDQLVIIGDGPDGTNLKTLSENLNISDYVHFLGEKHNPYVWMKNARKFVLSSKDEGFGLVIVEALLLNGYVISSNCKVGPSEILDHGRLGHLFEVGDVARLAILLCEDKKPELNVEAEITKFGSDHMVSKFNEVIENI